MTLGRRLLFWALAFVVVFAVCFFFAQPIFQYLAQPLADAMLEHGTSGQHQRMVFTALTGVFFTYVNVSFFSALFLCCPLILADLWRAEAVRSGRYERRAALYGAAALVLSFFLGGALAYTVFFPKILAFYLALQGPAVSQNALPIQLEPKVAEYLSQLMRMMFFSGFVFLLPAGLALLAGIGGRKAAPALGGPSSDRFE